MFRAFYWIGDSCLLFWTLISYNNLNHVIKIQLESDYRLKRHYSQLAHVVHELCQTIWQPSERGFQLQDAADVNNYQSDQFIILLKQQQHMWAEYNGMAIGRSSNIVTSQSYVAYTRINHRWKPSLIIYSTLKKSTEVQSIPYLQHKGFCTVDTSSTVQLCLYQFTFE